MNQSSTSTTAVTNGESTAHDLFALTDEQILEIEPEATEAVSVEQPLMAVPERHGEAASTESTRDPSSIATSQRPIENMQQSAQAGVLVLQEPPPWLAAQMKDPRTGQEARELWNGVQQAKSEAAAYRAAFATPEDAHALKELYPGGVNEARGAAERARVLDDIDRAYFGTAGKSAREMSASRAELAQRMLREDPAAFREMVFAGLRALEEVGNQPGAATVGATLGSPGASGGAASAGGASPAPAAPSAVGAQHAAPQSSSASTHEAQVAAYVAFEKAANEDLERSVGGAIERTLAQALPNTTHMSNASGVGSQHAATLQARLSQAIRQDVESALKGDRQLGEQVAQILSGRRLDEQTRGQVVRVIAERAQQLVPVAAKRVLNDWTQTTLAAHRNKNARADAASITREVTPVSIDSRSASLSASSSSGSNRARSQDPNRGTARLGTRRVDYRKLSDEQILDL